MAETRKLAADRGLANVKTLTANAEDLPFPDASFDLVVCRLAAHHFRKIGRISSARRIRVLMPGGTIGIVDNVAPDAAIVPGRTADELRHCAALFNAFKKLSDPSHVRCLGLLEWKTLLRRCRLHRHARRVPGQGDRVRDLGAAHALERGHDRAAHGDAAR